LNNNYTDGEVRTRGDIIEQYAEDDNAALALPVGSIVAEIRTLLRRASSLINFAEYMRGLQQTGDILIGNSYKTRFSKLKFRSEDDIEMYAH
jgi:hypothetical protein